jgi:hypothetical protein
LMLFSGLSNTTSGWRGRGRPRRFSERHRYRTPPTGLHRHASCLHWQHLTSAVDDSSGTNDSQAKAVNHRSTGGCNHCSAGGDTRATERPGKRSLPSSAALPIPISTCGILRGRKTSPCRGLWKRPGRQTRLAIVFSGGQAEVNGRTGTR